MISTLSANTHQLIASIRLDVFPSPVLVLAFGIDSPEHFEVIAEAFKAGEIGAAQISECDGNPEAWNDLLSSCRSLEGVRPLPRFQAD
jgi:hypothetical protein